jgi:hypothetical protein
MCNPGEPLSEEDFIGEFRRLSYQHDEAGILSLLENNPNALSGSSATQLILEMNGLHSQQLLKFAIETLDVHFNDHDFRTFIRYSKQPDASLLKLIFKRYRPYNVQALTLLNTVFQYGGEAALLDFISLHCKQYFDLAFFIDILPNSLGPDFYLKLDKIGFDGRRWLHSTDASGLSPAQRMIRSGNIRALSTLRSLFGPEVTDEIRDCFFENEQANHFPIPLQRMMAQNGCQAIVFGKNGQAFALPGQEARNLFQNMTGIKRKDPSFTVYLNDGHASIAFGDLHYGFYPHETGAEKITATGSSLGASTIANLPVGKPIDLSFRSAKKVQVAGINPFGAPCRVTGDSAEKRRSEMTNQLKLDFYTTNKQVAKMQRYVQKATEDCHSGERIYHALTRNCVDFVQDVIASAGTVGDYRDAFSRSQLWRRQGSATLYSLWRSSGPTRVNSPPETWYETAANQLSAGGMVALCGAGFLVSNLLAREASLFVGSYLRAAGRGCLAVCRKTRSLCGKKPSST